MSRSKLGVFFRSLTAIVLFAAITSLTPRAWAASPTVTLSGIAIQGPMIASTVTAYAVDPANGSNARVLATATTDLSGRFTLAIAARVRPLRLIVTGGSFVSEQDGASIFPEGTMVALLPNAMTDISGISINPLTKFINALTLGKLESGARFNAALASATAKIESYYALSTDPGQLMPDYSVAGVGTDAGKLGLILGALIDEDQRLCPNAPGGLVTALALDMVSGKFNGKWRDAPIP